jgi:nucleoside-diphosphate-sugar epimerase
MQILITGAAGYLGQLLVKKLSKNQNIEKIFALDKAPKLKGIEDPKIYHLQLDLVRDPWEKKIPEIPDVIIHLAFDIRTPYGRLKEQEFNNLSGSERLFRYCFGQKVKKLIYFSSVAAYGARLENIGKFLRENSPLTENIYPYGVQKRKIEEMLSEMILREKDLISQVFILRPASINGPEGEKRKKIGLFSFIKRIFPVLPITHPAWARQYLHEEDALRAVEFLIFEDIKSQFEIFNLAPPDFLTMQKMANLLHKKTLKIPIWSLKPIFFLAWHLTLGFIPTPPGSERFFIYPINVDGRKISHFGFHYKYNSEEAFLGVI